MKPGSVHSWSLAGLVELGREFPARGLVEWAIRACSPGRNTPIASLHTSSAKQIADEARGSLDGLLGARHTRWDGCGSVATGCRRRAHPSRIPSKSGVSGGGAHRKPTDETAFPGTRRHGCWRGLESPDKPLCRRDRGLTR